MKPYQLQQNKQIASGLSGFCPHHRVQRVYGAMQKIHCRMGQRVHIHVDPEKLAKIITHATITQPNSPYPSSDTV